MGVTIFRPGARLVIPGVQVMQTGAAASAAWWLSGGISAANCIAAYAAKGATNLAASYANLANTGTFTAAPGVAPTWDATNGWIFNGSTQYLTTGIVPALGWSAIARFSSVSNSGAVFGSEHASGTDNGYFFIRPNILSNARYAMGAAAGILNVAPAVTAGVLGIAGYTAYRNGSAEPGAMSGYSVVSRALFIAGLNIGSLSIPMAGNIQALAVYNTILSGAQISALSAAMAAL